MEKIFNLSFKVLDITNQIVNDLINPNTALYSDRMQYNG